MVTVRHMTGHLTPQQAARRARVGRTTIMRALEQQQLRAIRDNLGRWQIDPEAVDDWLSLRRAPDRQQPDMSSGHKVVTPSDTPETLIRVAVLEAENGHLRERLEELRQERDAWRAQAEKLVSQPPAGLIDRLLKRLRS